MALHSTLTKNHIIENWSFPNAAARIANGTYVIAPNTDLGKIAYQQDNGTYHRLVGIANPGAGATPTWTPVGGSGVSQIENGLNITSLSGAEGTSLKNKVIVGLPVGYKIVVTFNDADSFFTLQNVAPDVPYGDIATPNVAWRWRKTGGV